MEYIGAKNCRKCKFLREVLTKHSGNTTVDLTYCEKHFFEFETKITTLHSVKSMGKKADDFVCEDFQAELPSKTNP